MSSSFLFYFQIVCAIIFTSAQAVKMFESVEGVSVAFFLSHGLFALLNLSLSCVAIRETARTAADYVVKKQSAIIYGMWSGCVALHAVIALYNGAGWQRKDSTMLLIVCAGVGCVYVIAHLRSLSMTNPWVKAGLASFLKCVPQAGLAWFIYEEGSGGLSGAWIFVGHVNICTRIWCLWLSIKKGRNVNTTASLVSEIFNELSWLVATFAFLFF